MKVLKVIGKIERWMIVIGLALMTLITIYAVFNRFVLKSAISWSDEATRYLFIWVSLIGSSVAVEEKAHVGVSLFVGLVPENTRRVVVILANGLCVLFCIALIYTGSRQVMAQSHQLSAAMRINMAFVYSSLPASATLMGIKFIANIVNILRGDRAVIQNTMEVLN